MPQTLSISSTDPKLMLIINLNEIASWVCIDLFFFSKWEQMNNKRRKKTFHGLKFYYLECTKSDFFKFFSCCAIFSYLNTIGGYCCSIAIFSFYIDRNRQTKMGIKNNSIGFFIWTNSNVSFFSLIRWSSQNKVKINAFIDFNHVIVCVVFILCARLF